MAKKPLFLVIMLLCLSLLVTGCFCRASSGPREDGDSSVNDSANDSLGYWVGPATEGVLVTYTIWGVTPDLMYQIPLTVEADHPEDRPYQAMGSLCVWPDKSGSTVSPWPKGTGLELLSPIKNGLASVNITNLDTGSFGSSREAFALGSVVRTLEQFTEPDIKRVKILVDGKEVTTLAGHVDISEPLWLRSGPDLINHISWGEGIPGDQEATVLTLYFAEPNGMYLVPITRLVPETKMVAEAVLEELIKGPAKESGLSPILPKGTDLLNVQLNNGVVTVDFSKEISANHSGGSAGEILTIAGVVHSLALLPEVEKVQILIEGESGQSIGGHVLPSEPMTARYLNLMPRHTP